MLKIRLIAKNVTLYMDVITVAWDQKRRKALGGSSLTHLSTVHLLSLPGNREPTTLLQHTRAQMDAHFRIQLTRLRSFCSLKCEHLLKTSLPLKITIMSHVLNVSLMIQYLSIILKSFILTLFNLENKFSSTEARKVGSFFGYSSVWLILSHYI